MQYKPYYIDQYDKNNERDNNFAQKNDPQCLIIEKSSFKKPTGKEIKEKAYSLAERRTTHQDAYKPWTTELDKQLKNLYDSGASVSQMAEHLDRTNKTVKKEEIFFIVKFLKIK